MWLCSIYNTDQGFRFTVQLFRSEGYFWSKSFPFLLLYNLVKFVPEGSHPKKIAEKETLVNTGGRGVKKSPFFSLQKRGHILMEGGVACPLFTLVFLHSVSTQLVAFFEALHNVYFLYHIIKYLTWLKR